MSPNSYEVAIHAAGGVIKATEGQSQHQFVTPSLEPLIRKIREIHTLA